MDTKYHHGDLKTSLIENGLKIIQEEGIDKLSLRGLARICNVSEAAPYAHFKNKEDLLKSMEEYITDRLLNALEDSFNNTASKNKTDAILNMGVSYVLFFIEHKEYFNFIFNQPCVSIDLSMRNNDGYKPFVFFKNRCYEVYSELGMGDDEIKIGIISMWAKVHGIAAIASMKYVGRDFEWKDVLEKILLD